MGLDRPLPFIVAVTGHRDLREEDTPAIAAAVRSLLVELRDTYPETPLELLTPLAEGADRLAARVALDLGIPIIAVLPLEPDEYKKDFATGASIPEFDGLLASAKGVIVLPPPQAPELRPECYVSVAAYIVQHCHVLLALWDGVMTGKRGGTSEVVRARREGPDPKYARASRMLDPQETGLVYHIVTPRKDAPLANAGTASWLTTDGREDSGKNALAQLAGSTRDFNRAVADRSPGAVERRRVCEGYLVGDAGPLSPALRRIAWLFSVADDLAITSQRTSRWGAIGIFAAAALTVVAFEAVTEDVDVIWWFVAVLAIAQGGYWWLRRNGFDSKHLDYRSFAEALRVQFYWRLAGVGGSIAPNFMRYHLRESDWIRKAILAGDLHDDIEGGQSLASPEDGVRQAVRLWVDDQNRFFAKAETRDKRQLRDITIVSRIAGWLGTGIVLIFLAMWMMGGFTDPAMQTWKTSLVLSITLCATLAAALQGYADKRALDAQTKRYARMRGIFKSATRLLSAKDLTESRAREILRELGKEALEENADWVMLHRDRPLEAPRGPGGV